MTKLNEIRDNPGSHKKRMRVGRGPGSGKGKTAGRGVKGQNSRSGVAIDGFEGGQMPLYMRMPKRGFNNPFAKELAEVNLWRIAPGDRGRQAGYRQAHRRPRPWSRPASLRRVRDGVRLLGKGELTSKIDITVYSATASAAEAVEKAGGKLTTTIKVAAAAEAEA